MTLDLFDKKSINKCIKQIERYTQKIKNKTDIFVRKVGELGISIAKVNIGKYEIPQEVVGSIEIQKGDVVISGSSIQIIVSNDEALFWEYGTGLEGNVSPHPQPDGWQYNVKNHGGNGWVYTSKQGKLTQWSWQLKNGVYQTVGMDAQPFMYDTYNELLYQKLPQIIQIAKEVFGDGNI